MRNRCQCFCAPNRILLRAFASQIKIVHCLFSRQMKIVLRAFARRLQIVVRAFTRKVEKNRCSCLRARNKNRCARVCALEKNSASVRFRAFACQIHLSPRARALNHNHFFQTLSELCGEGCCVYYLAICAIRTGAVCVPKK